MMFLLPVLVALPLHFLGGAEADITGAEVRRIRNIQAFVLQLGYRLRV
ncbi:MAG: hypothetical protein AAF329_01295 [Cyanobacteria bacterium P01_A01_bin.17]